jgi:hypothetical protein
LASEAVGGQEAMVFDQARKVSRNLSGTDPDIGALGRLVIASDEFEQLVAAWRPHLIKEN